MTGVVLLGFSRTAVPPRVPRRVAGAFGPAPWAISRSTPVSGVVRVLRIDEACVEHFRIRYLHLANIALTYDVGNAGPETEGSSDDVLGLAAGLFRRGGVNPIDLSASGVVDVALPITLGIDNVSDRPRDFDAALVIEYGPIVEARLEPVRARKCDYCGVGRRALHLATCPMPGEDEWR